MSDLYLCACEQFYKAHGPDCPAKRQFDDLKVKLAEAEKVNRIAAGCISVAYPHFHSKHPQDVLDWLKRQAIDAAKGK